MESSLKLRQFWKANPRGNYDIDLTWKFRREFDFQNRRNIDEFSTWIFRRCFDVKSTELLYWLFLLYYFLTFSALGTYSKLFWYSAETMRFQQYWRNHWYWNYWNYMLWEFLQQRNQIGVKIIFIFFKLTLTKIIMPIFINKNSIYLPQNNTNQVRTNMHILKTCTYKYANMHSLY